MATQRIGKAKANPVERLTDYKLTRLCSERARLDEERLELDRASRAKSAAIEEIDRQLAAQCEARKRSIITLTRWEVGLEQVRANPYYKRELIRAVGEARFQEIVEAQPMRTKLFVRDKKAAKGSGGGRAA